MDNRFASRRAMLQDSLCGFGYLAFAALSAQTTRAEEPSRVASGPSLLPRAPHFPPKAKRVIFLFLRGGPPQCETFDYKPSLAALHGQRVPESVDGKKHRDNLVWVKPRSTFSRYGRCGKWASDHFSEIAKHSDEICFVHSLHHDQRAHDQAIVQMHTGESQFIRPTIGSWVLYGLGCETNELPGFVSMTPDPLTRSAYSSAFLPAVYSPVHFENSNSSAAPFAMPHLANRWLSRDAQVRQLETIQQLNRRFQEQRSRDSSIDAVIDSFERGFRMQAAVPELMDLSDETRETLELYGAQPGRGDFAAQCLLARRMVERGVRFVEITDGGWDWHLGTINELRGKSRSTDKPIGALLTDLKRRGLLEDTLVLWGGEFGRTPNGQQPLTGMGGKADPGTDHHPDGFTWWLAGGGIRGGVSFGATDEFGYHAVEDKVSRWDLYATILHVLGLDHRRLTYHYGGRDYRLTDIHGNVVHAILA